MSMGKLSMVAQTTQGALTGEDRSFDSVSTDTRTLQPGQLFFALSGERFDAAEFVAEAARRGAAGAVVKHRQVCDLPQVEVGNTRSALGALAKSWRSRFSVTFIAVTGSNGKTTVKEMIGKIFAAEYAGDANVLITSGNFNNEIGLPLTVLKLRDHHRAAIFEMGASRPQDIAYLADIATPDIGVVTNAAAAHLEGFGSEESVAATKGEMFASLSHSGVAIVNRDDRFYDTWCEMAAESKVVSFGLHPQADFRAENISEVEIDGRLSLAFDIVSPAGSAAIRLPMSGRHNVRNALAAAAASSAAGVSGSAIQAGLAAMSNVTGRLQQLAGLHGVALYDDTYNANPGSVQAAIEFLSGRAGENWIVLGDMAELGSGSAEQHRFIGRKIRESGITRLYCIGEQSRAAASEFGASAEWFANTAELAQSVRDAMHSGVNILVKGSRSMGLEAVIDALRDVSPAANTEEGVG
jgi:UDP-N-acetylmuramoyl-tripeptide--D-alanyl-D-alanine ligase